MFCNAKLVWQEGLNMKLIEQIGLFCDLNIVTENALQNGALISHFSHQGAVLRLC